MEDSNILAKYVYKGRITNLDNISQLSQYVTNFNFGDLVELEGIDYVIGKEGKLILAIRENEIHIPYSITRHLIDATNKYQNIDSTNIDLRSDDIFINNNINDHKVISIELNCKLTLTYYGTLIVNFQNSTVNTFMINNIKTSEIIEWFEGSFEEQSIIYLRLELKDNKFDNFVNIHGREEDEWMYAFPKYLPSTWSVISGSYGGQVESRNFHFSYTLKGPQRVTPVIKEIIRTFCRGYQFELQEH